METEQTASKKNDDCEKILVSNTWQFIVWCVTFSIFVIANIGLLYRKCMCANSLSAGTIDECSSFWIWLVFWIMLVASILLGLEWTGNSLF